MRRLGEIDIEEHAPRIVNASGRVQHQHRQIGEP